MFSIIDSTILFGLYMHILKLNAIDSTNKYLKELSLSKALEDFTAVWAHEQQNGKGQMGAKWVSEPGKNLTFSVLKKHKRFNVEHQFLLNIGVSLAILDVLHRLSIPDLSVKWPNDILSGTTKICGILIENTLIGNQIQASIIGIGLNVNQLSFNNLTNVSSLKLLSGQTFNLEELLKSILEGLNVRFLDLENEGKNVMWNDYEENLFRKDKPSTFSNETGQLFMGFIRKVSKQGKLVVELEDAVLKEFDLKEIKLLY